MAAVSAKTGSPSDEMAEDSPKLRLLWHMCNEGLKEGGDSERSDEIKDYSEVKLFGDCDMRVYLGRGYENLEQVCKALCVARKYRRSLPDPDSTGRLELPGEDFTGQLKSILGYHGKGWSSIKGVVTDDTGRIDEKHYLSHKLEDGDWE